MVTFSIIKFQLGAGTVTRGVHQQFLLTKLKICLSFTLVCTVTFGSNTERKKKKPRIHVSVKELWAKENNSFVYKLF